MAERDDTATPGQRNFDPNIPQTKGEQSQKPYAGELPERLGFILALAKKAGVTVSSRAGNYPDDIALYFAGTQAQVATLLEQAIGSIAWPSSFRKPSRCTLLCDPHDQFHNKNLYKLSESRFCVRAYIFTGSPEPVKPVAKPQDPLVRILYHQRMREAIQDRESQKIAACKEGQLLGEISRRVDSIGATVYMAARDILAKAEKNPADLVESSKLGRAIDDLELSARNIAAVTKKLRALTVDH